MYVVCVCVCVYGYLCMWRQKSVMQVACYHDVTKPASFNLGVCVALHVSMCVGVFMCVYVYIYGERSQ